MGKVFKADFKKKIYKLTENDNAAELLEQIIKKVDDAIRDSELREFLVNRTPSPVNRFKDLSKGDNDKS